MRKRLIRLLTVGALWAGVAMFARPVLEVVHAAGDCQAQGSTYLYRANWEFVDYSNWYGDDPGATDASYCFSEVQYRGIWIEGGALCNEYGFTNGQGIVQTQFNWGFTDENGQPYGGYYDSYQDVGPIYC